MSFIFADGFDWVTAWADLYDRGYALFSNGVTIDTVNMHSGRACLSMDSSEWAKHVFRNPSSDTVFISFWFRSNLVSLTKNFLAIFHGGTSEYYNIIKMDTNGKLSWMPYSGGALAGPSTNSLTADTWHHIEIKCKFTNSTSAGDCLLKVDGGTWLDLGSGKDTMWGSIATGTGLGMYAGHAGLDDSYFDELVIWDDQGGAPWNTWQGKLQIETLKPNGNGNSSDFLGSDADSTDNYLHADEDTQDGDTSYSGSATVTDKDLYAYQDITGDVSTVQAVQVVSVAKRTGSTTRKAKALARTASIDYQGSEVLLGLDAYEYHEEQWLVNPNTTSAWIESEVNGAEFGLEITT